jgi:phosphohistidine swiveling domain-containing protein
MIRTFGGLRPTERVLAGGKGGTLAQLYQAGYPVPDGFVILPEAFATDELKREAWTQVRAHLQRMRDTEEKAAFAIRSSALAEDSGQASFAGEFETVLDVSTDEEIHQAIHAVRKSRLSERVQAYSKAKDMDTAHEVAVVVQQLVPAELAGVLFTANPITGSGATMTGSFVRGLGDKLVSGEADALEFTFRRPKGEYSGPSELRSASKALYRLASRLEEELGAPQDIEWAIAAGKLYLLQSRPITTVMRPDPAMGLWNDSLDGDYLWCNQLTCETFPGVMTPSAWSIWQILFDRQRVGGVPGVGNIGGRPYTNISLLYSMLMKLYRSHERVMEYIEGVFCTVPEGMEIPAVPIPTRTLLFELMPNQLKTEAAKRRLVKQGAQFVAAVPGRCRRLHQQILAIEDKARLRGLWYEEVEPLFSDLLTLQDASNEKAFLLFGGLRKELTGLVGQADADALLSAVRDNSQQLASVAQLVGLSKVAHGQMGREEYVDRYGHRGTYENELSMPRPAEDPAWLDNELAHMEKSHIDVATLLEKRDVESEAVWERLREHYPRKGDSIHRKIPELTGRFRTREAIRAELTRVAGVIRDLFLRSGQLTGLGDDVFFLTHRELMSVLSGDDLPTELIPTRRDTYGKYSSLPPYPSFIRGQFDPFAWASDPDRRTDVFDPQAAVTRADSDVIRGYAGSAGRVEGTVRRICTPEEGDQLQAGEVLVTATTNVGWTSLFPRAAAIVTDVGAQLSHAAIVARELGIPAVVGCGDATMRLKTGDRVLVDGRRGVVEILEAARQDGDGTQG